MVKRLFSRLFASKAKKFHQALEYERKRGVILEIDADEQWFVALVDQKLEDLVEGGPAMLILFEKQSSSQIVSTKLVYDSEKKELFIGDIESRMENKGYGSILLQNVIKLAGLLGSKMITGNLSSADSGHFDKLAYWYGKYGFEVKISGDSGTIAYRVE